jgi:excisionase family DNA binding protein
MLSLREAADLVGVSKSTILRAVQKGRLSATKTDQGEFKIDPAEVTRVYDKGTASHRGRRTSVHRAAPEDRTDVMQRTDVVQRGDGVDQPTDTTRTAALLAENAALSAENRLLRELVERLDRDKDAWKAQAERLALAPPRHSWWPWRRAG